MMVAEVPRWREGRKRFEALNSVLIGVRGRRNTKRAEGVFGRISWIMKLRLFGWRRPRACVTKRVSLLFLPAQAGNQLLTLAEKKELKEHRANSLLIEEVCDQYLAHIQNPNNPERPKDQVNPPQRVGAIKEAFGERSAASLQAHEIKDWLISLGLAAATLNRYKSTLSAVYTYAKERKLVESNPCRDVSHFAVTLGHPRWMSDAEEDKLRAVLETWIVETPQDYEMTRLELREHPNEITVGSQTGMRKGNQYALTWPDINFRNFVLHHLARHRRRGCRIPFR